ncbi:MAG: TolC family protein [Verrucomicrobiota bacterium]
MLRFFFLSAVLVCELGIGSAFAEDADTIYALRAVSLEFQGKPKKDQPSVTLDQILRRVLKDNFQIRRQQELLEASTGDKIVFHARALPDVKTSLLAGRYGDRNESPARNFAVFGGRVQQPIFEAGIPASWRAGDMAAMIAQQNLQSVIVQQLHTARRAFYDALFYRGLILLQRQIEKHLHANLANEQQRLQAGLGTRGEVVRAKIQMLDRQPELTEARAHYRNAILQLSSLLGMNLGEQAEQAFFPQGILEYEPVSFNLEEQTQEALQNRVDLRLLRSLMKRTAEDIHLTQAAYYPALTIFMDGEFLPENALKNRSVNTVRSGEDTRNSEYRIGSTMSWTMFDGGRTFGVASTQKHKREREEILLKRLEENAPREISRVLNALRAEEARMFALQKSARTAEENLKNIEAQMTAGGSGQLDFLNAQTTFYEAKFGILQGLYRYNVALAELDLATGRYLRFIEAK